VLELLLGGLTNKEDRPSLHISPHTVHNHLEAVYRALGVSGRAELLARCLGAADGARDRERPPVPAGPATTEDTADLEHLRSIVDAAPDRIVQVDRDGVVLYINNTSEGRDTEQVIGTSVFDHVVAEDHPIVRSALDAAFTEGTQQEYTVRGRRLDGAICRFHSRLSPIQGEGELARAVIIARELTETDDPPPG
jgi:PAS domain S-box-containing protein